MLSVWSSATDAYDDGYDLLMPDSPVEGTGYAGVYHQKGPEWAGPTGFYYCDMRAEMVVNESKTWPDVYVWAPPDFPDDWMQLTLGATYTYPPPPTREYSLTLLQVPEGVVGAPEVGTVWRVWPLRRQTSFGIPLPTYRSTDGLTGYKFSYSVSEVLSDFNRDGDVDLIDYDTLRNCYSGPGGGIPTGQPYECDVCDVDGDEDVDLIDYATMQISGPDPHGPY